MNKFLSIFFSVPLSFSFILGGCSQVPIIQEKSSREIASKELGESKLPPLSSVSMVFARGQNEDFTSVKYTLGASRKNFVQDVNTLKKSFFFEICGMANKKNSCEPLSVPQFKTYKKIHQSPGWLGDVVASEIDGEVVSLQITNQMENDENLSFDLTTLFSKLLAKKYDPKTVKLRVSEVSLVGATCYSKKKESVDCYKNNFYDIGGGAVNFNYKVGTPVYLNILDLPSFASSFINFPGTDATVKLSITGFDKKYSIHNIPLDFLKSKFRNMFFKESKGTLKELLTLNVAYNITKSHKGWRSLIEGLEVEKESGVAYDFEADKKIMSLRKFETLKKVLAEDIEVIFKMYSVQRLQALYEIEEDKFVQGIREKQNEGDEKIAEARNFFNQLPHAQSGGDSVQAYQMYKNDLAKSMAADMFGQALQSTVNQMIPFLNL